MPATTKQPKRKPLSAKWQKLLRLIPGYDPFAQAEGYWFDVSAAEKALAFFPECIRHVEGANAGEPFALEPWEQCIVANLFGWKRIGSDARRYREVFIYLPRGNGKTAFVAAIAIFIFFCDPEPAQQDYIAAGEREQAGFLFRHVKGMVKQEPELDGRCRIYGGNAAAGQSKSLVREEDGSFLRVIAADGDTQHGGNTHLAIIDEVHVQKNRELFEAFRTSMAKKNRRQPLLIGITTADFARESLCNEWHGRACRVRDNKGDKDQPGYDPAFLPVIYETARDEDWRDEKVWEKANPNIDISVSREELRRECKEAQENPASENSFRRLHLNQKTEQDCRVIPMDQWERCGGDDIDEDSLAGRECMAGLDLSTTTDITAFVMLFRPVAEGEPWIVVPRFWVPGDNAKHRSDRDRVPYLSWIGQGLVTVHEGNRLLYHHIRRDINELGKRFSIQQIAYDPWNATQLALELQDDGFEMLQFRQGFATMNAPTKELLAMIGAGELAHGGNPVLRWMASNAASAEDPAGNLKFNKAKSTDRIDGIIALTMALGLAMTQETAMCSAYDTPGSFSL